MLFCMPEPEAGVGVGAEAILSPSSKLFLRSYLVALQLSPTWPKREETLFLNLRTSQTPTGTLRRILRLAQDHLDLHALLPTIDTHRDGVSRVMVLHDVRQVLLVLHILAVHGDDQVSAQHDRHIADVGALRAGMQARFVRCAPRRYLDDQQPRIGCQSKLARQFRTDRQRHNAQCWPAHAAQGDQVVEHGFGGIDGYGKADAGALLRAAGEN